MLLTVVQLNLCIMDTLETFISVLITQFSLHAKMPFVAISKCADYVSVQIMQVPYFQES